jgi:hypothetical protein
LNRIPAKRLCPNIGNRHLVDLVSVLVDDDDEPASPVPARRDRAVFEIACERQRVLARGGIAGQVNTFVIIQNLFAVGENGNSNAAWLNPVCLSLHSLWCCRT